MEQLAIIYPIFALVLLTFGIGIWLGKLRFSAVKNGDLNPREALIKSLGFWASQIFSIKASFRRRMSIRQEKITQRLGIWLSPLRAGL